MSNCSLKIQSENSAKCSTAKSHAKDSNEDNRSDCVVVLNELCGGVEDSPVAIAPGISDLVQPGFLY